MSASRATLTEMSLSHTLSNGKNGLILAQELFGALERSLAGTWTVFCEQDATAGTSDKGRRFIASCSSSRTNRPFFTNNKFRAPELRAWSGYQVCQPKSIFNITWTENFEQKEKRKRAKDDADTESSEQWKKQSRILEQKKDNAVFRNVIDDGLRVASAHENLIAGMLCPLKSSKPSYEQANEPVLQAIVESLLRQDIASQNFSLVMDGVGENRFGFSDIFVLSETGGEQLKNPNYVTKPLKPRQNISIPSLNNNNSTSSQHIPSLGQTSLQQRVLVIINDSQLLTVVFLNWDQELGQLGTKGVLAEAFATLIRVLWNEQYNFVSSVTFKTAIGRFSSQFSGTEHDFQEFLAFLLDGLHEDLNLIVNKPMFPDMTPEEEQQMVQMECISPQIVSEIKWENYLRNSSVVVSLFQGQFRNTLRCLT
ncbi:15128_t:CDS:10, partial [Funneliformis geosporum]